MLLGGNDGGNEVGVKRAEADEVLTLVSRSRFPLWSGLGAGLMSALEAEDLTELESMAAALATAAKRSRCCKGVSATEASSASEGASMPAGDLRSSTSSPATTFPAVSANNW